jgi:hypothetical protein
MQPDIFPSTSSTSSSVTKPTVVAIGNSHLAALQFALKTVDATTLPFRLVCLPLTLARYQPYWSTENGARVLNQLFDNDAREAIERERPIAILCFAASGLAFAAGSFNRSRPFDFIIPGHETLERLPDAQIVPYDLMIEMAMSEVDVWLQIPTLARAASDVPVWSICIPPPVASFDPFLLTTKHEVIKARIQKSGVAPKAFRYKMWLLQTEAERQKAQGMGAAFLPPPAAALDDAGYRRPDASQDLLHGNAAYGRLILQQIGDIVQQMQSMET